MFEACIAPLFTSTEVFCLHYITHTDYTSVALLTVTTSARTGLDRWP